MLTATPRGLYAGYAKMYLKHYMLFRAIKDVRSHTYLLCNVILSVGCTMSVASSTSMIIWCDHCLLFALWIRFPIELATCLLFRFRSSHLSPKNVSDTAPLKMRRENSGIVNNYVVVWVVWSNFCFLVWLFAITVMSSLWRFLFVDVKLSLICLGGETYQMRTRELHYCK